MKLIFNILIICRQLKFELMEESDKLLNEEGEGGNEENEEIIEQDNKFAKDQMFLNPLEKYAIYNKFPFVLTLHLFLVIFLMYQLINNCPENEEGRHFKHFLYEMFLPLDDDNDGKDKTGFTYQQHLYIYNIDELKDIINKSLTNYFDIENISIENITHMYKTDTGNASSPEMFINYLRDKIGELPGKLSFDLNINDFGPLNDNENAKIFINNITSFKIVYYLMTIFPNSNKNKDKEQKCIGHEIEQIYSFENSANIDLYLKYNKIACANNNYIADIFWSEIIIIILAIISLLYTYFHIVKRYKYYLLYIKEETKKFNRKKNDGDKLKEDFDKEDIIFNYLVTRKKPIDKNYTIVDIWTIVSILGNAMQIIGAILTICDPYQFNSLTGFITSMGTVMALLLFIKYMDNLGSCSIIFETIKRGVPPSLNYLIGVLPAFIGYAILGKCIFWRSEFFATLTSAIASLFALMNGDSVYFIFDDLIKNHFFLGTIYCYSFCIMFIVIVMNIFLGIIGEAFVTKKEKKYKQWIYYILQMEEKEKRKKLQQEEEKEAEKNKSPKELLNYRLNKIYEEFDNVQKLSVVIISKSTTKNIVELRSKFGEQLSILDQKMDRIKKSIKVNSI